MATRGVNGAAAATLNARFIKCGGCNVNVPKEDMLALGKCTVCGRAYEPEATADGRGIAVETVAFEASSDAAAAASGGAESDSKPKRRRWAVLTSKKGRTYYHNSETGEDTWEKPHDLDAEAADDAFVPFKNDAVKNAVLREQAKTEATRMGVPMEVIAAAQRREQENELANDPLSQLNHRQPSNAGGATATRRNESDEEVHQQEASDNESNQESEDDDAQEGKKQSCVVM